MGEHVRWAIWGSVGLAVILAIVWGPLVAGFAMAGAAFVFMFVVMGMHATRVVGDWCLEHGWRAPRIHLPFRRVR